MSQLLTRLANRAGTAPGVVGASLLLQLGLIRALASATSERVFVLGRELHWGCWFKARFGVPCPTCGMTRSVLLSLHGQFVEAARLNPAGLVLVCGLVLFGLSMLFLMFYQQRHRATLAAGLVHRRIRIGASVYASLFFAVMFAHWLAEVASR